ncbi:hypothetical protein [Coraliomargarita parva]|uniref:hypothetical protein n=1 Tax=Coraliomargarita parva TaxID=3014050 RepID=UPI0022B3A78B|nr:hypothetical protein [Coraliomargarita parva]
MPKFLYILTGLFLCAHFNLRAQTDENTISISFTCLAWDTTKANGIQYLNGEEVETLRVGQSRLNGPYSYTGPNPIVFFRERPGGEPGTVVREPVARAYVEPNLQDVLFLFSDAVRMPEAVETPVQAKLNTLVMNHDFGAFPMGSFRIINLSKYQVGCILGDEKFVIPGKETKLIEDPADDKADMRVHFSMKIDDQWEPKINTGWMYHSNRRALVFLTDVVNSRRPYLKMKTITDFTSM